MSRHSASPRGTRSLVALAVAVLTLLGGGLSLVQLTDDQRCDADPVSAPVPTGPPGAADTGQDAPRPPTGPEAAAAAVLAEWDTRRSAAWADGSIERLRALYVPGSAAGRNDVRMLRAWRGRGLTVDRLTTQLLEVQVLPSGPDRMRMRVTDRVTYAEAVGPAGRRVLPRDQETGYLITMQRYAGQWRMWSVRGG